MPINAFDRVQQLLLGTVTEMGFINAVLGSKTTTVSRGIREGRDVNALYPAPDFVKKAVHREAFAGYKSKSPDNPERQSDKEKMRAVDSLKVSPLMCVLDPFYIPRLPSSSFEKRKKTLDLLLKHGADINREIGDFSPVKTILTSKDIREWTHQTKGTKNIFELIDWNKKIKGTLPAEFLMRNLRATPPMMKKAIDKTENKDALLIPAIKNRDIKIVDEILKAGADINKPNDNGERPLEVALELGASAPEMTDFILSKGASSSYKTSGEMQSTVCKDGMLDSGYGFELLERMGIKPDMQNAEFQANVEKMFKTGRSSHKTVETLKNNGFDFDKKDKDGTPYLILATQNPNFDGPAYDKLLRTGVDLNATDKDGKTALDYADRGKRHALTLASFEEKEKKKTAQNPTTTAMMAGHIGNSR